MNAQCPQKPEESVRFPGIGVTDSCEALCGCWEVEQLVRSAGRWAVSPSSPFIVPLISIFKTILLFKWCLFALVSVGLVLYGLNPVWKLLNTSFSVRCHPQLYRVSFVISIAWLGCLLWRFSSSNPKSELSMVPHRALAVGIGGSWLEHCLMHNMSSATLAG